MCIHILKVYIHYISGKTKKNILFLLPDLSLSAEFSASWQQHVETGQAKGGRGRGKVPVTNLPGKNHTHASKNSSFLPFLLVLKEKEVQAT
jgi:hypothetical protein